MRQAIEERMNGQIEKSRTYNGMFDAAVTAVETVTSGSAVQVADNQFSVTSNTLTTYITCSDNDYATINVNIDYQADTGNMQRVADLNVNINGAYEETYHSIPRAIRSAVFDIVNDVIDAVCGFLDNQNYSDAIDDDGE
jgi:hypothetical protein